MYGYRLIISTHLGDLLYDQNHIHPSCARCEVVMFEENDKIGNSTTHLTSMQYGVNDALGLVYQPI